MAMTRRKYFAHENCSCVIILWWWVRFGERKISIFILFTFYISWHGVLYTTIRRVRAYETIRWQRTLCCNTRLLLHARDVILPFVYNYSKTISSVYNNNIIFSAVKIISTVCIAPLVGSCCIATRQRLAAYGRRGQTRVYITRMILYILSDEDGSFFFSFEINIRLPIARLRI